MQPRNSDSFVITSASLFFSYQFVKFTSFEKSFQFFEGFRILLYSLRYGFKPQLFPLFLCFFVKRNCVSTLQHRFRNLPVFRKHETFSNCKSPELKKSVCDWYPTWATLLAGVACGTEPQCII